MQQCLINLLLIHTLIRFSEFTDWIILSCHAINSHEITNWSFFKNDKFDLSYLRIVL